MILCRAKRALFAFAQRSGAMKAPVGLLSDRTVLRKQDGGTRPDKFAFAQRSGAMKAPVGLLSDRTVLRKQDGGTRPDKFAFAQRSGAMKAPVGLLSDRMVLRKQDGGAPPRQVRVWCKNRACGGWCRPAKGYIKKWVHESANGQPELSTAEEINVKNMEVFL